MTDRDRREALDWSRREKRRDATMKHIIAVVETIVASVVALFTYMIVQSQHSFWARVMLFSLFYLMVGIVLRRIAAMMSVGPVTDNPDYF